MPLGGNVCVTMNLGIAILSLSGISISLARPPENIPPSARLATLFAFVPTAKTLSHAAGPLPRIKSHDLPDFESISRTLLPPPSVVPIRLPSSSRLKRVVTRKSPDHLHRFEGDAELSTEMSACGKVSSWVGMVPFGSPRSRNQVSFGENWALRVLRPIPDGKPGCFPGRWHSVLLTG